ncbi:MAG: RsiV family protein [Minisyncoccia bacterium]
MKKNSLIAGIVVLVVIAAAVALYATGKIFPREQATANNPAITLPPSSYSENAKYYDIAANYASTTPLLTTAGALADATARSTMYGFIRDTIVQFKTDGNFDKLTSDDVKAMGFDQGRKEKLQIVYMISSSPRTVSYIFTITTDTLGAHPNTAFRTFTFDTKTGAELSLSDIFAPGSNYLDTLSTISRTQLPTIIGPDADTTFIANGTTPNDSNFANFFVDNSSLVFLFPPYQVAPYAAGPQTLPIALSQLSGILKAEYK